jgi:hypothetical protein
MHAFPVLDTIALKDASGNIEEKLYLLRDPRGPYARTKSLMAWNFEDSTRWTTARRN